MRRWLPRLVLLPLLLAAAACGAEPEGRRLDVPLAAAQGSWRLGWNETYGEGSAVLRFRVESFRVTRNGWAARIAVANETGSAWTVEPAFGVMLFADDDLDRLQADADAGRLPARRPARTLLPESPPELAAGEAWEGTISARGRLPAGAWVRLVFGTFRALGSAPEGMQAVVSWITDEAHRLPPR